MSLISKIFKKKPDQASLETKDIRLQGRFTDLQQAYDFAEKNQWNEALIVLDRILDLPADTENAINNINEILNDSTPLEMTTKNTGKDASGNWVIKGRYTMGGGMLPKVMGFRAQCLLNAIISLAQKFDPSRGVKLISDPGFDQMARKGLQHAQICQKVFWNDPDNLAFAGAICHTIGRLDMANSLLSRALELDPKHQYASEAIKMTKERLAQYPKM